MSEGSNQWSLPATCSIDLNEFVCQSIKSLNIAFLIPMTFQDYNLKAKIKIIFPVKGL